MTAAKPIIAVLGAGSWGTALAVLIARNGYRTLFWGHDAARQARLAHERENARYLPGVRFPENLIIREDLIETAEEAAHLLLVVPSHAFRATLEALQARLPSQAIVAWATKGLEPATGRLLSQVAADVLGEDRALGVISGPTFAKEVAQGLPTAVTVAARDFATAEAIAAWLRSERVRVYTSTDLIGVELGGAIKNVLAIATGISDGLGLGANARAALITRGLAEMRRLTAALGGKPETVMGLAGIGDLVLIFAASLFSLYTVIAKPLVTRYGPLNLLCYSLLFGAPPVVLATLPAFLAAPLHAVPAEAWFGVFWAVAVSSFIGWIAWAWVNAVRGIARSAPLQYLMPPIAGLVAWLTLGETFTWLKIAGAAIAMAGIAWAQIGVRSATPPDAG